MVVGGGLGSSRLRPGGVRRLGLATGEQASRKQKEGKWSACHTFTVKRLSTGVGND
jgi:hypothetical protein